LKEYFPFTPSPNNLISDYTADGVKRSIKDSCNGSALMRSI
jgi:D-threo-aldose 1-dehydrogenase